MEVIDEGTLSLNVKATRQLALALVRDSDLAGLITVLDMLTTSALERWLVAERDGGQEVAAAWEQCVAPAIEKLGWICVDAVRVQSPMIVREALDHLGWMISLRTLASQRIPVDYRVKVSNEVMYWLMVMGAYSVFRQRWDDVRTLLSVRVFRRHDRIQVRLWSKKSSFRGYDGDIVQRVASSPELLALFLGDRENAVVNLCQFQFIAAFPRWPDTGQWYPWDNECGSQHLEVLIEVIIEGELGSRVYEAWTRPQFAAYISSLFGPHYWQTGPIAEFLASASGQS